MRARIVVGLVGLAAGCGRFGFDETDPVDDAPPSLPDICNARSIGMPAITGVPTKVRATALASGHALAIETDTTDAYVVRIDASGGIASTHLPFDNGYVLHGISQIGDRPFVYVFTSGAGYIKMLVPDWSTYDTGPSGEQFPMDPQQALLPDRSTAVYGVFAGGLLAFRTIDTTGTTFVDGDYQAPAVAASFASAPNSVRVVVENAGACETFRIRADGTTGPRHVFSPCVEPLVATLTDDTGAILHRIAPDGDLAVHLIPAVATDPGVTIPLESGKNPRIAKIASSIWVAYLRSSGEGRVVRVDGAGRTSTRDFFTITSAFDLLPSGAFWVDDTGQLSSGDPCP